MEPNNTGEGKIYTESMKGEVGLWMEVEIPPPSPIPGLGSCIYIFETIINVCRFVTPHPHILSWQSDIVTTLYMYMYSCVYFQNIIILMLTESPATLMQSTPFMVYKSDDACLKLHESLSNYSSSFIMHICHSHRAQKQDNN